MSMLSFDPKAPSSVVAIQKWFATIITRPTDEEEQMLALSPSGRAMSKEAAEFIVPNQRLTPDKRIQIYNQQYWWRLLTILHENFPALTRLFGYTDFNQSIGVPFLMKYPSRHWSLSQLGNEMERWIEEEYTAADKPLVLSMAIIDWAYQNSFIAPCARDLYPSLDLLTKKMRLQEHVKLLRFPFDAFSFRSQLLQEPVEFWTESDFPQLHQDREYFFLLYRAQQNFISYKTIEEGQWILLHALTQGFSIEEACNLLEVKGGDVYEAAQEGLGKWIQEWFIEKLVADI